MISDEIKKIENAVREEIHKADTIENLDFLRIQYLGREQGILTHIFKKLKDLPPEERKTTGEVANKLRQKIEESLDTKKNELWKTLQKNTLKNEWLDVTRPGTKMPRGHIHPISQIIRDAEDIFSSMGFETVEGPEVETEYYNFDALNIPAHHPARDMWDTFWIAENTAKNKKDARLLLRTHTSPVQIRYMKTHKPPIRIVVPGRAYRYEATDASHDFQFHQLEGLVVDNGISIANFKAVIREFFSRFLKTDITIRLRPSYFPFTEPSFEVDFSCVICKNHGCSVCKQTGWLEMGGAGMVHPNVFKAAELDPKTAQGFAFGFGMERLAMMKYEIPDIRLFHSGDIRFLNQF